ncbi:hypothetical protein GCM10009530_71430 [Microbispora corallina]|uniref:Uncharacterized protein n=1 Tax=Microbispora corallina TaxID=83302 RepID=A0ABQ4G125_9ACTN|nr:hypothetical protein Mco01_37460 [Microbispora corallina]
MPGEAPDRWMSTAEADTNRAPTAMDADGWRVAGSVTPAVRSSLTRVMGVPPPPASWRPDARYPEDPAPCLLGAGPPHGAGAGPPTSDTSLR